MPRSHLRQMAFFFPVNNKLIRQSNTPGVFPAFVTEQWSNVNLLKGSVYINHKAQGGALVLECSH